MSKMTVQVLSEINDGSPIRLYFGIVCTFRVTCPFVYFGLANKFFFERASDVCGRERIDMQIFFCRQHIHNSMLVLTSGQFGQ